METRIILLWNYLQKTCDNPFKARKIFDYVNKKIIKKLEKEYEELEERVWHIEARDYVNDWF